LLWVSFRQCADRRAGCLTATSVPELFTDRSVHPAHTNKSLRGSGPMNGIIYLIGLIVVIMAILSFLGLR
jgi:hypothetical protein